VLSSWDTPFQHIDANGLVLKAPPTTLGPTLGVVQPDLVALDPALPPGQVAIEELELAPRILAGVVAPDAASLAPRWLARVARGDLATARVWLANLPVSVVLAHPAPEAPNSIPFSAWRLNDAERALAIQGDTAALAVALERSAGASPLLRAAG
jgi:hypothetical protein